MSVKGWTMSAVAVAVAAGTYFVLNTVSPHEVETVTDKRLLEVEQVFAGSLQQPDTTASRPADRTPPPGDDDRMVAMDEPADYEAPFDATEGEMPLDDSYEDEAPAATPEPTPEPTPTPRPTATPAPAPTATPAPTPAAPAATPAPKPATTPKATPKPAPKATPAQVTQWWGTESTSGLSLVYAGSAAYTRAVVLMFNGSFSDAAAAGRHLRVTDEAGRAVSGQWQINERNPRMLIFPVDKTGTYTVSVNASLTDRDGRKLSAAVKGPVRVQ